MPKLKSPPRRPAKKSKPAKAKAKPSKKAAKKPPVEMKPDQHERLKLFEKKSKEERAIDEQIAEVERKMATVTHEVDAGKSELKSLKKQHVTLHTELRQVVRGEGNLFADANEPKSKLAEVAGGVTMPTSGEPAVASSTSTSSPAVDDTAWRAVYLASLTPAIPPKKLQLLADHHPTITTMGELADWQEKKGQWWAKDIKGLGDGGMEKVVEAQAAYWQANPRKKAVEAQATDAALLANAEKPGAASADPAEARKLPGADDLRSLNNPDHAADDFVEDAIDQSTRETVAEVEHHLQIDLARRTSGPWQSGYMLTIGKLERSRPIGIAPHFPTRAEAIADAIAAVGGHLTEANGQISGKAQLAAARQIRASLAAVADGEPDADDLPRPGKVWDVQPANA